MGGKPLYDLTALTHSVSHNLLIELNGHDVTFVTLRKTGEVAELKFYPSLIKSRLEELLGAMPEIYTRVELLVRKKDFIIIPEEYFETDWQELFTLNHTLPAGETLFLDKTEHRLGVVYPVNTALLDLILGKFSRLHRQSEVSILIARLYREVNFQLPRIFLSVNSGHLILLAVNEGKLLLCNGYRAKSMQEVFYFVMLAVEQLKFLPAETELVLLGEPAEEREIIDLFKNYLRDNSVWKEDYQIDAGLDPSPISRSFALQTRVCES